jgi:hypothetical protein
MCVCVLSDRKCVGSCGNRQLWEMCDGQNVCLGVTAEQILVNAVCVCVAFVWCACVCACACVYDVRACACVCGVRARVWCACVCSVHMCV